LTFIVEKNLKEPKNKKFTAEIAEDAEKN